MTNSTSTDVTVEGAWCNRVEAKQENSHSAAPADKQTNEKIHTTAAVIRHNKNVTDVI